MNWLIPLSSLLLLFGGICPTFAENPTDRPIILTSDADLERARQRIENPEGVFDTCWNNMRSQAFEALNLVAKPYAGQNHEQYHRVGTAHGMWTRNLALVSLLTDDTKMAEKAKENLLGWAVDEKQFPFSLSQPSHSAGLVISRVVVLFADSYALLYDKFDQNERDQIDRWLKALAEQIRISQEIWRRGSLPGISPPYLGGQEFNSHLIAHGLGLIAIGYATADQELIEYALTGKNNPRNLERMIEGTIVGSRRDLFQGDPTLTKGAPGPQRGELYERYTVAQGTGLRNSQIQLRLLTLAALIARNNQHPTDFFAVGARRKQSILAAYEFYSEFVLTDVVTARTGYYAGDNSVDPGFLPLFEIADTVYPEDLRCRLVLESRSRLQIDRETFSWSAPLIHGADDIVPKNGDWKFDTDKELEGWRTDRGLEATVRNGNLQLEITSKNPVLISPGPLDLDTGKYPKLLIRMQNKTDDYQANVFFSTREHPTFEDSQIDFELRPIDDQLRDYIIDLSQHEHWKGTVERLRIDVVHNATFGNVVIDEIRLLPSEKISE